MKATLILMAIGFLSAVEVFGLYLLFARRRQKAMRQNLSTAPKPRQAHPQESVQRLVKDAEQDYQALKDAKKRFLEIDGKINKEVDAWEQIIIPRAQQTRERVTRLKKRFNASPPKAALRQTPLPNDTINHLARNNPARHLRLVKKVAV